MQKYSALNKAKFTTSGIQYRHAKKQENTTHNEEKNQSIEINPELTQMLELANKNLETVTITVFYMFRKQLVRFNRLSKHMDEYMYLYES